MKELCAFASLRTQDTIYITSNHRETDQVGLRRPVPPLHFFLVVFLPGRYACCGSAWAQRRKDPLRPNSGSTHCDRCALCAPVTRLCARTPLAAYPCAHLPALVPVAGVRIQLALPIPVGYDQYLHIAFGDYMQPPPKEKRIQQHEAAFMDLDCGYEKYRGVEWR